MIKDRIGRPRIYCACGCREKVSIGKTYVWGHHSRLLDRSEYTASYVLGAKKAWITRKNSLVKESAECACGCGEYANSGKKYIHGHNGRNEKTNNKRSESMLKHWKGNTKARKNLKEKMRVIRNTSEARKSQSKISRQNWKKKGPQAIAEHMVMMREAARHGKGCGKLKTRLESTVGILIKSIDKGFVYTGDGTFFVESKNPDFVNKKAKKIIEVDSQYWHSKPERRKMDRKRDRIYMKNGYDVLKIGELEFRKYPVRTRNKIKSFVGR